MKPVVSAKPKSAWRQRGYLDGRFDRPAPASIPEQHLPEYRSGVATGRRERERDGG